MNNSNTFKGIENLKFINLENNNQSLSKFIITFKKNEKHVGKLEDFHHQIGDALYKYASNLHKMNKLIVNFDQIIIDDKNYFNIYIDLLGNNLTKKQIESFILDIDGVNYKPHQVLNYGDLIEINIFKMLKYPYLSDILLILLETIHTTSYIDINIIQAELVKRWPNLSSTESLIDLAETVSYFNKKKNDK